MTEVKYATPDDMTIEREIFTDNSTIGQLHLDGVFFCWTLELSCRKTNLHGRLAISPGRYQVVITKSPKLGYYTPELLAVPKREGIRIHPANWPYELEGCIAPGNRKDMDAIFESRTAYERVFAEIEKRLIMKPFYISVIGGLGA